MGVCAKTNITKHFRRQVSKEGNVLSKLGYRQLCRRKPRWVDNSFVFWLEGERTAPRKRVTGKTERWLIVMRLPLQNDLTALQLNSWPIINGHARWTPENTLTPNLMTSYMLQLLQNVQRQVVFQYSPEAAIHDFSQHWTSKQGPCACEEQSCVHAAWASACCSVFVLYVCISQPPAANWLQQLRAVCRGGNKEWNWCVYQRVHHSWQGGMGKKEINREKVKVRGKDAMAGGLTKRIASVCRGIVFWVLIFWSVLRTKKCNILWWISNRTLVCCARETWIKWLSNTQGRLLYCTALHQARYIQMCSWWKPLPHFTVKS